jgi:myxalamid-type polyketide synthase MxaB
VAIADVCFTANTGRSQFAHRLALIADSSQSLHQQLEQVKFDGIRNSHFSTPDQLDEAQIVFCFTDQSASMMDVGRQLYHTQPTFRRNLEHCDQISRPYLASSLLDLLYAQPSPPDALDASCCYAVAVFALEYALAQLWRSWGIEPVAVLGEGIGEYVAACVAGVLSLDDGLQRVVERERSLPHAAASDRAAELTGAITYTRPEIQVISSATGQPVDATAIADAAYWRNPYRQPADWQTSFSVLANQGYTLIEIGVDANLADIAKHCTSGEHVWLPSLRQGQEDWLVLLQGLSTLYKQGVAVNWAGFDQGYPRQRVQLPTYPFNRQRYWIDVQPQIQGLSTRQPHPLLGERLRSPLSSIQFAAQHRLETLPLVTDHRLNGIPVINLVLYLELAVAGAMAARGQSSQLNPISMTDVLIPAALVMPETGARSLQLVLNAETNEAQSFQVFSLQDEQQADDWILHATGQVCVESVCTSALEPISYTEIQSRCTEAIAAEPFYQRMAQQGATLGPTCQMLAQVWQREGEALGKIQPSSSIGTDPYYLPLGAIDACFQLLSAAPSLDVNQGYIISSVERFQFFGQSQEPLWSHVQFHPNCGTADEPTLSGDVSLFTETGQRVAEVTNVQLRPIRYESLQLAAQPRQRTGSRHQPALLSREELVAAQPEQRYTLLETYLLQCLSRSLQLPIDTLDTHQPLGGWVDSLMAFELRSRIEADLQVRVPMDQFLGSSSIAQLTKRLLEQLSLANLLRSSAVTDLSNDMEEIVL